MDDAFSLESQRVDGKFPYAVSRYDKYGAPVGAKVFWWDSEPVWSILDAIASARQKKPGGSQYHGSSHLLGINAEYGRACECGIGVNTKLLQGGDGGVDFPYGAKTYNDKGVKFLTDPDLKVTPDPLVWCDVYILSVVNLHVKRTGVVGWATKEEVQAAPLVDYGYGPRHSINWQKLHLGMPPELPVVKKRYKFRNIP